MAENNAKRERKALKNRQITARTVFLIGSDGKKIGRAPTYEAIRMAEEKGLDLIMVNPSTDPPTCKIADYGKTAYENAKREKESKASKKKPEQKEVRFTPSTDAHDLETKAKAAKKFLEAGHKVRASLKFRGREQYRQDEGRKTFAEFAALLEGYGKMERPPASEGRFLNAVFVPDAGGRNRKPDGGGEG